MHTATNVSLITGLKWTRLDWTHINVRNKLIKPPEINLSMHMQESNTTSIEFVGVANGV